MVIDILRFSNPLTSIVPVIESFVTSPSRILQDDVFARFPNPEADRRADPKGEESDRTFHVKRAFPYLDRTGPCNASACRAPSGARYG
jgi:hypothetical protein